ncbi:MAG: hypothetical protein ACI3XS_04020 [Eubacteriales bacterium]
MKKFSLILVLLLLICALSFTSCSKNLYDPDYIYDGESLVGKWREENYNDEAYYIYEFDSEGKATYKYFVYGIEYQVCVINDYHVTENNKITISNDHGEFSENYFSINSDGKLIISDGNDDVNVLVKYDLTYNINTDELTGEWIRTDEDADQSFVFNGDGTMVFKNLGESAELKYSVKDNTLYMMPDGCAFISDNVMKTKYNKEGNVLKLIADDGSVRTFKKV